MSPEQRREFDQISLMRALRFDEEDLAANRAGKLSERQKNANEAPRFSGVVQWVVLGHIAALGGLMGIIALISGNAAMWLVMLLVLGFAALPVMMLNRGVGRPILQKELAAGRVQRLQGEISKEKRGTSARFYLECEGQRFHITPGVFNAFRDGASYILYILPESSTLISAEPFQGTEQGG